MLFYKIENGQHMFSGHLQLVFLIKIIPWLTTHRKVFGHIFGVSKQVGLVYKCAISGEAISINFLFSLSNRSQHTTCTLIGMIVRKDLGLCFKTLKKPGFCTRNLQKHRNDWGGGIMGIPCQLLPHRSLCHKHPTLNCQPLPHRSLCHKHPTLNCQPLPHRSLCHKHPTLNCQPLPHRSLYNLPPPPHPRP